MSLAIVYILLTIFFLSSNSQNCEPFSFSSGLIVNGDSTIRGEFPFLIALWSLRTQEFFCAANLISTRNALTAAHCVYHKFVSKPEEPEDIVALLGKFSIRNFYEPGSVVMEIKEIIVHKDWKPYVHRYDADIAILVFTREVILSDYIKTVCLPAKWQANDLREGQVVGWGVSERTQYKKPEDTPRRTIIKKPPSNEFCFLREEKLLGLSSNRTFCAEGEKSSPCLGDSGGGFFVYSNSLWTIQGLVSASLLNSDKSCDVTTYSIYTNVALYVDWIYEAIGAINNFQVPIVMDSNNNLQVPIVMNCSFGKFPESSGGLYGCSVYDLPSMDNLIFSGIIGKRRSGKTIDDVELLSIRNIQLNYIPSGISDVLPNLITLFVQHGKLTELSRKFFKNMSRVEVMSFTNNQIERIAEDTFYEVPELYSLRLGGNRLTTIPYNLFIYAINLEYFDFPRNRIVELDGGIFRNCPLLLDIDMEDNNLRKIKINFSNYSKLDSVDFRKNECINVAYSAEDKSLTLDNLQSIVDTNCS